MTTNSAPTAVEDSNEVPLQLTDQATTTPWSQVGHCIKSVIGASAKRQPSGITTLEDNHAISCRRKSPRDRSLAQTTAIRWVGLMCLEDERAPQQGRIPRPVRRLWMSLPASADCRVTNHASPWPGVPRFTHAIANAQKQGRGAAPLTWSTPRPSTPCLGVIDALRVSARTPVNRP
jgi:hypothetical protein